MLYTVFMNKVNIVLCLIMVFLTGCSSEPPRNVNNSCAIFDEKDDWYSYAYESFEKWGVPVHVQLAIIHQESRFVDDSDVNVVTPISRAPCEVRVDGRGQRREHPRQHNPSDAVR